MPCNLQALPLALLAILAPAPPQDEVPAPAPSTGRWVEYQQGNSPLILLAPHGGRERPEALRDRREGVRLADSWTFELTAEIAASFEELTGRRPHVIRCRLHRSKLDVNREEGEAAQGDEHARAAWRAWHACIERARAQVARVHGHGLLLDVHGHAHEESWIEWGYALSSRQLELSDAELHLGARPLGTTIDALARRHDGDRAALVRGPFSLGALTEAAGYPSVPAPGIPHPDGGRYFNGGYNVRRHGSRVDGAIDAVQMEVPRHLRAEPANRKRFALRAAASLSTFLEHWYAFDPRRTEDQQ